MTKPDEKPTRSADETPGAILGSQRPRWTALACVAVVLWLFFTIYLLRLDHVVGMAVDDAWYILLAKALATGEGYQMINSPTPGIRPITPPVFPALLAAFWRLRPDFPANLWLLKSVSIAAMLGVGAVAVVYFKRCRELPLYLSVGIAAATVFYPPLVLHATSMVMSEPVFMLVQLAAIIVIERGVRERNAHAAWRYAVFGGALASLAYLTRSAGAGLLVAVVLYLVKERCPRQALIAGAIIALSAGSWMSYTRAHVPTPEQRAEQASSIIEPYTEQFWQRVAGDPSAGKITAGELPGRVWKNLNEISRIDMGAAPLYLAYRAIIPGQLVQLNRLAVFFSLVLTLLALAGFITVVRERVTLAELVVPLSLTISLLWSWEQFRFLLPLIPFLIFYQLMGVKALVLVCRRLYARPGLRVMWTTLAAVAWVIAALNVYANLIFIQKQYSRPPGVRMQWHSDFEENARILGYVRAMLPADAVLATQNPALVHLFTRHKTVALGDPASSSQMWNRVGVRYLVYASPNPLPPFDPIESRHATIYRQGGRLNLRIVDLGPQASRPIR